MISNYTHPVRNGLMASFLGILVISSLILGLIPSTYVAYAQEAPPMHKDMALVTTQFGDSVHNKYLFDPEKASSSFKAFYDLNSNGKMIWNVTISPTWYELPRDLKHYDVTCKLDRGNYFASTYEFITDSLQAASKDLDLTKFDYVMILYPRYDSASDHSCTLPERSWIVDGKEYHFGLSIVRESASYAWLNDNLWVMEHVAGHFLGLPDLYVVDDGQIPAAWDVMGWAGGSHNSTLLGGWSKMRLGWIVETNVKTIDYGGHETVTLDALGIKPSKISLVKLPITSDGYYLLEVRLRVGSDFSLPATVAPGVVITWVDENLEIGKVKWISNPSPKGTQLATEIMDIAFLEGDKFSADPVGSIKIMMKSQNSYVIDIDRSSIYPRIIEDKYDYDGNRFVMPQGWKSRNIGWDIFAAKDNPLIGIAKLDDAAMSVRVIDPVLGQEDYSSNPLFGDVKCKPLSQAYLELNTAKVKEMTIQCSSPADSANPRAPSAKTYYFGYSQLQNGSGAYIDKLLSLTLVADSKEILEAYLPVFEEAVNTVQVRDSKDIRVIENEKFGLREQVQRITISNSTQEIPLLTNSLISEFKFDPEQHMVAFKVSAKDSNGISRVPYDTFLRGPFWVRVDGETDTSFLILKDKISGQESIQLAHHTGVNDVEIVGTSNAVVAPPSPENQPEVPDNEKPVEIRFTPAPAVYSIRNPPAGWKWADAAMILD